MTEWERELVLRPLLWVLRPVYRLGTRLLYPDRDGVRFETIRICDRTPAGACPEGLFTARTLAALNALKTYVPGPYARIVRQARTIANQPLLSGAAWDDPDRTIQVDFSQWRDLLVDEDSERYDFHCACYAGLLVHEATHARLWRAGVPYNHRTWRRVETICLRAERRAIADVMGYEDSPEIRQWVQRIDLTWWEAEHRVGLIGQMRRIVGRVRDGER